MAKKMNVDFSGVKDRGNFNPRRVEEGDYRAVIVKVEDSETKENKDFQYLFTIKLKKFSQNSYPYYCQLTEKSLWKLRNLLVAAGISVPKKKIAVDPNKAVGREIGVTMADDEYEGKMKSVIDAVFPVSELEDGDSPADDEGFDEENQAEPADDTSDDEPKKKKKKSKKDKKGKKKGSDDDNLEELDISDL